MRKKKYSEALSEATLHAMQENPRVFLIGEGIDDPKGAFGTTSPALKMFGPERVMDSPLSEAAMTGIGIGAAIEGWPCVMVHMRNEFLLYAMDQIVNHAAKWHYMTAGKMKVPIVIRCLVGRGWGQAAQHSQSLHAMFAHVPGLKVILPSNAYDAKGLMYAAIRDNNPVLSIEHRWLYDKEDYVPEEAYELPIGKANVAQEGKDITCVAVSYSVLDALQAREALLREGIDMEVIDVRSVRPLDRATIVQSVRKTGRLIVLDTASASFGCSAEIITSVTEKAFNALVCPPVRIALPDAPTPCSPLLESIYYPNFEDIVRTAKALMDPRSVVSSTAPQFSEDPLFQGPF